MHAAQRPNEELVHRAAEEPAAGAGSLASGTLLTVHGRPAAGATVRFDLEPMRSLTASRVPRATELVKLGEAVTDAQGRWSLQVNALGDLSGYREADGSSSLLVTAHGKDVQLLQHLQVKAPRAQGAAWSWSSLDAELTAPAASGAGAAGAGPASIQLDLRAQRAPEVSPDMGVKGGGICAGSFYWDRSDANVIKTWDRVQRIFTASRTTWEYEWDNENNTTVDAAANLGRGGALVRAGLTKIQTNSAGFRAVNGVKRSRDLVIQLDNRAYFLYCRDPGGSRYSGVYEWRPLSWTGGNRSAAPKYPIFKCNPRWAIRITFPTWTAQKSSHTYGVGAELAGVGLRVAQTNSSSHKLTFNPRARARLCGSNNYPVYARQVREL